MTTIQLEIFTSPGTATRYASVHIDGRPVRETYALGCANPEATFTPRGLARRARRLASGLGLVAGGLHPVVFISQR